MDPQRTKPKRLNKALLSDIASTAIEKQLRSAGRANNVAGLYMVDKRFNRSMLRNLEKCDSAELSGSVVRLHGPNEKSNVALDSKLFTAVLEHSGLTIPTVELECGFDELSKLKLTGVESLKLVSISWGQELEDLVRVITENKSSLKALLDVPEALFDRLPRGLILDEFSTCYVKPRDVKIPALNAKVFKYEIADNTKIPLAFMRTVNAEEIHLQIDRLLPGSPKNPFGAKPANYRTKKLRVEIADERVSALDFGRIFREVAVCFPKLECFELVHEKRFKAGSRTKRYTYGEFTNALDELVACLERALMDADKAPYKVHLKTHATYAYTYQEPKPEEADFECGLLKTDQPSSEEVDPDKQHAYFVKEVTTDRKSLRVDCEIAKAMASDDDSDVYDYDFFEDYYDYGDPYDSDGHFRGYDYDSDSF